MKKQLVLMAMLITAAGSAQDTMTMEKARTVMLSYALDSLNQDSTSIDYRDTSKHVFRIFNVQKRIRTTDQYVDYTKVFSEENGFIIRERMDSVMWFSIDMGSTDKMAFVGQIFQANSYGNDSSSNEFFFYHYLDFENHKELTSVLVQNWNSNQQEEGKDTVYFFALYAPDADWFFYVTEVKLDK